MEKQHSDHLKGTVTNMEKQHSDHLKGTVYALISAICWGISGVLGQFLLQERSFDPVWLVTMRLLVSGFLLLIIAYLQVGNTIFKIWISVKAAIALMAFSIFGMLAVQVSFFMSIKYSNAATATVLLFLNPIFILLIVSIQKKLFPSCSHLLAVVLALLGSFLMVTHGNFHVLSISTEALLWGISSAFAVTFYTLFPGKLIQTWQAPIVVGWGMMISGISLSFFHAPWQIDGTWDILSLSATVFVVLFGSLVTFYLYLVSVQYIGGSKVSLLSSIEPLVAAIFSVLLLNTAFLGIDWIGMICIVLAVMILSCLKLE